jgi:hypothetical protein
MLTTVRETTEDLQSLEIMEDKKEGEIEEDIVEEIPEETKNYDFRTNHIEESDINDRDVTIRGGTQKDLSEREFDSSFKYDSSLILALRIRRMR